MSVVATGIDAAVAQPATQVASAPGQQRPENLTLVPGGSRLAYAPPPRGRVVGATTAPMVLRAPAAAPAP